MSRKQRTATASLTVEAMKARIEEIRVQSDALREEWNRLDRIIYAVEDAPLVGRFFCRNGISRPEDDSEWKVWTRVESFDPESGAHGTEYRWAYGEWYDVKLREQVRHDDLGAEVTREEFYAGVQPFIDVLTGSVSPTPDPRPHG